MPKITKGAKALAEAKGIDPASLDIGGAWIKEEHVQAAIDKRAAAKAATEQAGPSANAPAEPASQAPAAVEPKPPKPKPPAPKPEPKPEPGADEALAIPFEIKGHLRDGADEFKTGDEHAFAAHLRKLGPGTAKRSFDRLVEAGKLVLK